MELHSRGILEQNNWQVGVLLEQDRCRTNSGSGRNDGVRNQWEWSRFRGGKEVSILEGGGMEGLGKRILLEGSELEGTASLCSLLSPR